MKKLAILVILLGTAVVTSTFAETTKPTTPLKNQEESLILGDGYTSYDAMSVGESALNMPQTNVIYDDLKNYITMGNRITYDKVVHDLNVDMSESIGWGPFSESAEADYARHTADTRYTENFTFEQQMYANAQLDISKLPYSTAALSAPAQQAYQAGIKNFTDRYGDDFIQQLPMGALLLVNIQINFDTYVDRQSFDSAVSGDIADIFSASAAIQDAISQTHSKGSIEISAYQTGGDPTRLANIFTRSPSGNYYLITCRLDNLSDCTRGISGVIAYAQTDFSKQIQAAVTPGAKPQGNLSVAGAPTLMSYASKFGLTPAPGLDPSVMPARLSLADTYNTTLKNTLFVGHLLNSQFAPQFAADVAADLKQSQANLAWNMSLFNAYDSINCYTPGVEGTCSAIWMGIQKALKLVDTDVLAYMDMAYVLTIDDSRDDNRGGFPFGSHTLYPLGDHQFAAPDLHVANMPSLAFAPDNSTVSITWYSYSESCGKEKLAGALPNTGKSSYAGALDRFYCHGGGWQPSGSVVTTLDSIENPV